MPPLTPDEIAKKNEEQTHRQSGHKGKPAPAASLSTMLGQGQIVTLCDKEYELARFPLGALGRASAYFAEIPIILKMHCAANASEPDAALDAAKTAERLNALRNAGVTVARAANPETPDVPEMTAELTEQAIDESFMELSPKEATAIAGVIVLSAGRRQPELFADEGAAEALAEQLDPDEAMEALRVIFYLNPSLRRSF